MNQPTQSLRTRTMRIAAGALIAAATVAVSTTPAAALTCLPDHYPSWIDFDSNGTNYTKEESRCLISDIPFEDAESFDDLMLAQGFGPDHADILRLYEAFFGRQADIDGAIYWLERYEGMRSAGSDGVRQLAQHFAYSDEFSRAATTLSDSEFVAWAYNHILRRDPEPAGGEFWETTLASGRFSRGDVVYLMAQGEEFENSHLYVPLWQQELIYDSAPADWIPAGI